MAFHFVPAPEASGNSSVCSNSLSGAISMLRDELYAAASVIAAEVATMEGDPELAELAATRTEQLGRIAFLLEATSAISISPTRRCEWIKRGIAQLRDRIVTMAPYWDYGSTEIDRLDSPGAGPGRFFELKWLGL